MDRETLLNALRQTACDNLRCVGCGYEHNCSLHGCAINRAATEMIEAQAARIAELEKAAETAAEVATTETSVIFAHAIADAFRAELEKRTP